jgi:hypothetical protein
MARRISTSQFRSKLRQLQSQQRQAVQRYNQEVRRRNQKLKSAVDSYNRAVRAYTTQVSRDRQRIRSALNRLQHTPVTHSYTVVRTSAYALHESYVQLERHNVYGEDDPRYGVGLALPQQESANSLAVANALLGGEADENDDPDADLRATLITDELSRVSPDLHDRWHGALFSLNPRNPDAARHFCTSVREIFTQILHTCSPDDAVVAAFPDCARDGNNRPTRRARIHFLLRRQQMQDTRLEEFVEKDIDDVIELFDVFNKGAHGAAGTFGLRQLNSVKRRVEDAIFFVTQIAG